MKNSYKVSNPLVNIFSRKIRVMISPRWLLNGSKISQNEKFAGASHQTQQVFIFTGDTNFPYFDHCQPFLISQRHQTLYSMANTELRVTQRVVTCQQIIIEHRGRQKHKIYTFSPKKYPKIDSLPTLHIANQEVP